MFGAIFSGILCVACDPSPGTQSILSSTPASQAGTTPSDEPAGAFDDYSPRLAPDGRTLVFVRSSGDQADLYTLDIRSGTPELLADLSQYDVDPAISPDGSVVLFDSSPHGYAELYVVPIDGGEPQSRSGVGDGWATYPSWSPDGESIVYSCGRPSYEEADICVTTAEGESLGALEPASQSQEIEPSWSPDGNSIAFASDRHGTQHLFVFERDTGKIHQITSGSQRDSDPAFKPDGSLLAFTSQRGDEPLVCMIPPGGGHTRCITEGVQPSWSADGRSLVFYRDLSEGSRIFMSDADGSNVVQIT